MSQNGPPSLSVNASENTPPDQVRRFTRSPHPYRKQWPTLRQDDYTLPPLSPGTTPWIPAPQHPNIEPTGSTYFDADHRKRRKDSSSSCNSGTEADDERGGGSVLLGLPAPPTPTRLRKGLKGAYISGTASPLLTPSYLDEEPRRLVSSDRPKRRASLQSQTCLDEETTRLRATFTRRRRAELIRRFTETCLLGLVGSIVCKRELGSLADLFRKSVFHSVYPLTKFQLDHTFVALWSHAVVVLGLYVLYPLRIIYQNHTYSVSRNKSKLYIRIPAAFEPAPLLYPVLVPVFIALSLMHTNRNAVLPNLVLSIASIPNKISDFNTNIPWYSSTQWLLSVVPILFSQQSQVFHPHLHDTEGTRHLPTSDYEALLLLYPLHQALLPTLGYLTTTSLLPAELQLLSIAMINLLLSSDSPQIVILQSVLWMGGLSIFIMCGKVLTLGVALARIPSWRFRKSPVQNRRSNVLISAVDDCLNGRLSNGGLISASLIDSDESDDEDGRPRKVAIRPRPRHQQRLSVDTRYTDTTKTINMPQLPNNATPSATEDVNQITSKALSGAVGASSNVTNHKRQRRSTLPSYSGSPATNPMRRFFQQSRTLRSNSPKSWSLRSLTKAQAAIIKWAFAVYTYAVVLAMIAIAIRTYIGQYALHGQEPVGWALSYLFGDIPQFRCFTADWNLDSWIRLPSDTPSFSLPQSYSRLEIQACLGMANIRLLICLYCLAIIFVGLLIVMRLSSVVEVDTRRKVFHGMMVAMFLPTIFIDPTFISLAFILILAMFLSLDLFRASQLPPLSKPLTYFLAPYVDGRDHRGPIIVSHIFLLIGCAIPLWLSLADVERTGEGHWEGWDVRRREVSMISGVVCVGMGDAAASLIGRRYGRRRWCWSGGKSLEGSLAFAVAVVLGLSLARAWLVFGGWDGDGGDPWPVTLAKASIAAAGASLTEAVLTGGNDNVIVPVILWLLVRGLQI